ncbi:MAG: hypothetical protein JO117_01610 [Verrucomicrobia bacterium]|nr:hypothetical protein [Verrucomicrobiota bacterium]
MKPFEESLTAWLDDRLDGEERADFERTLAVRPDAVALHEEKRDVARLRALLREHLPAMTPALGHNADFFSHQLQKRIAADTRATEAAVVARPARPWWAVLLGGSSGEAAPARLLVAGAACLLLAAAGIYALIPSRGSTTPSSITASTAPRPESIRTASTQSRTDNTAALASASATPAVPATSQTPAAESDGSIRMANVDTTRKDDPQLADIVNARVPAGTATSATPVHFDDQNADVLWLDGLEYQPDTPSTVNGAENPSAPPSPPAATPAAE